MKLLYNVFFELISRTYERSDVHSKNILKILIFEEVQADSVILVTVLTKVSAVLTGTNEILSKDTF